MGVSVGATKNIVTHSFIYEGRRVSNISCMRGFKVLFQQRAKYHPDNQPKLENIAQ